MENINFSIANQLTDKAAKFIQEFNIKKPIKIIISNKVYGAKIAFVKKQNILKISNNIDSNF